MGISGHVKGPTKDWILERISTYDIYRYYQGHFEVNQVVVNHHRGEKDPSMIIGNKVSDDLTHKDFGDSKWRGNAFSFVEQIHSCNFQTALNIIARDFGLMELKVKEKPSVINWEKPKNIELKLPPLIQVVTRKLNKAELSYWEKHYQGEDDLKREHIYAPKTIYRDRVKQFQQMMTFCYYFPEIDKWKLYRPQAPKRTKHTHCNLWKWDTNVPFDCIENISNLSGCNTGFLGKSRKDRMVLMTALQTNCIASVQAEDASAIRDEDLEILKQIPERWCVMDNDKKGKEFSWWLTKEHGFKHINVPDKYNKEGITDFADLACSYGLGAVVEHFKKKGI